MKLTTILIISIAFLTNCTKSAGVGGKATIKGNVIIKNIKNGIIKDQYNAQEHNIYLIYGEGELYSDDKKNKFQW